MQQVFIWSQIPNPPFPGKPSPYPVIGLNSNPISTKLSNLVVRSQKKDRAVYLTPSTLAPHEAAHQSHPFRNRPESRSPLSSPRYDGYGARRSLRRSPAFNLVNPHDAPFRQLLILGVSVFYAILAVWAILTVIGILRLRPWARYSILVIGGGLAGIGTLLALGTAFSRTMLFTMPTRSPAPDPHIMAVIFAVLIAIYIGIAIIGIWWLVYFNLRTTRELFLDPSLSALSPGGLPQRSIAITILAGFFFYAAVCCVTFTFLPFPAFLLGFIFPAKYAHVFYLAFAVLSAFIGYGLLKLKESARLTTIAFLIFGCCNVMLSFLPWYQVQFRIYMVQFTDAFSTYPNQSPAMFPFTPTLMLVFGVFGLAIYALLLWLLHRHRTAFTPPQLQTNPS